MFKKYKTVLVSGPTGSGKTTLLTRYIDYMQKEDDVNLVIIDPKQVELFEYKSKGKAIYIAENYEHLILDVLKPIIENRLKEEYPKAVVVVDEFAELTYNKDILEFFNWMFESKEQLNLELVLTSQRQSVFSKELIELSDVVIKLN
jgi:DNA segregation ATPase FtsK/SpoIIIE-like protein